MNLLIINTHSVHNPDKQSSHGTRAGKPGQQWLPPGPYPQYTAAYPQPETRPLPSTLLPIAPSRCSNNAPIAPLVRAVLKLRLPSTCRPRASSLVWVMIGVALLLCTLSPVQAQTNICSRSPIVRVSILGVLNSLPGGNLGGCGNVDLTRIEGVLHIPDRSFNAGLTLTSLQSGDFDGLTRLTALYITDEFNPDDDEDILAASNLTALPEGIFSDLDELQYLDLSNNSLSTIERSVLIPLGSRLRYLNLEQNPLTALPSDVFRNLVSLQSLRMQNTDLSELPSGIFDNLVSLQDLNLQENDITVALPADLFKNLGQVEILTLYRNLMVGQSTIPAGSFHGMTNLKFLYIDWNPKSGGYPGTVYDFTYTVEQVTPTEFRARSSHGAPRIEIPWTAHEGSNTSGRMFDSGIVAVLPGAESASFSIDRSTVPEVQTIITIDLDTPVYNPLLNSLVPDEFTFPTETIDRAALLYEEDDENVSYGSNLITGAPLTTSEPGFVAANYTFTLSTVEIQPPSVVIGTVEATDADGDAVSYLITTGDPTTRFSMGASSGVLRYIGSREEAEATLNYTLSVSASDGKGLTTPTVSVMVTFINILDEVPVFDSAAYTVSLNENESGTPTAIAIGTVSATTELGTAAQYSLSNADLTRFSIGTISGVLSYIGSGEDFEKIESYTLTVQATDPASSALFATAAVTVTITSTGTGTPDTAPVFDPAAYTVSLNENEPGTPTAIAIGTVSATTELGTAVQYSLSNADLTRFSLHTTSGVLSYIGSGEDFEGIISGYTLTVQATDPASSALFATAAVTVTITNTLDTAPVFAPAAYTVSLNENEPGAPTAIAIGTVSATTELGTAVQYSLSTADPTRFSLHTTSGVLSYIGTGEDFEGIISGYTLTVQATDPASSALFATAAVTVTIANTLDTAPVFAPAAYTVSLNENEPGAPTAIAIGTVSATTELDTAAQYSLSNADPTRFSLHTTDGVLSYIGSGEDFEGIISGYTLTVQATDPASSALFATAAVTVTIANTLDTAPVFDPAAYTVSLNENEPGAPTAIAIGTVSATTELGTAVQYSLSTADPTRFSLHTTSGVLSYIGTGEDFEGIISGYTLTVQATDPASSALFATAAVTVTIANTLDTAPVFDPAAYTVSLNENESGALTAIAIGTVSATTEFGTAAQYSLSNADPTRFSLHTTDGVLSYIGSGEDFEGIISGYTLTVQATDGASSALFATAAVTVTIANTLDTAPVFDPAAYTVSLNENESGALTAIAIGTVSATTELGTAVQYSLSTADPTRFSLHTADGVLSYIGTGEDFEGIISGYTLTVQATDPASSALFATAAVTVTIVNTLDTAPVFAPAAYTVSLNENEPGTPTAIAIVTVSATTELGTAVQYSLSTADPTRFSLHTTDGVLSYIGSGEDFEGIISGYTLTVTATDPASSALFATAAVTVTIANTLDTAPVFAPVAYTVSLNENESGAPTAIAIGTVSATTELGTAAQYSLSNADPTRFSLHTTDGVLSYIGTGEDFEGIISGYTLTVTATDPASSALFATAAVTVTIVNTLDTAPVFDPAAYTVSLNENEPGTPTAIAIGTVSATTELGTAVQYSLSNADPTRFSLHTTDGVLSYIGSGEDFEGIISGYTLTVQATDPASSALFATAAVTVTIANTLDTAPVFAPAAYTVSLNENEPGAPTAIAIGTVSATTELGTAVQYSLSNADPTRFSLAPISGALSYIGSGEDFEGIISGYTLTVQATDPASSALFATAAVTVTIANTLDTAPVFDPAAYTVSLNENESGALTAIAIGTVSATTEFGTAAQYSLSNADPTRFSLHTTDGVLSYIGSGEDFEGIISGYTLTVQATDGASSALFATAAVTVTIANTLDTAPVFDPAAYTVSLNENESGALTAIAIGTVSATTELGTAAQYSLSNADPTRFSLHTTDGVLSYIGSGEDFEGIISGYTLTVQATDPASSALFATAAVTVTIVNTLDTAPVFDPAAYTVSLNENEPGTPTAIAIVTVSATTELGTAVQYSLSNADPTRFSLHTTDGVLSYIGSGEDFEGIISGYTLTVQATDPASSALFATAAVTVTIANTLDTAPVFAPAAYTVSLNENESGSLTAIAIGTVSATTELGTAVQYSLSNADPTRFSLHTTSGALSYIGSGEDFESIESYTLTVTASDTASPALTAAATIVVAIGDVDDAPNTAPVFIGTPYSFDLNENQPGPVLLGTVSATDNASTVSYALRDDTPTRFSLHTTSGALSYIGSGEDFESIESYTLTVTASDTASPALTAAATIVVAIGDVDDAPNTAPVFIGTPYSFDLNENQPGPVLLGTVSATDNASTVSYALRDDTPTRFSLHTTSGALSYIGSGEDFESIESYTLTVTASDTASPALTAAATIVVAIGDVDDAPNTAPVFIGTPYSFDLNENQPGPVLLGTVSATDNASTVSYALRDDTPTRFSLHTTSGALSYIGSGEDFESIESYTLTVTASDTASPALTAAATIVVAIGDVDDAPNTAPVFIGTPYSFDLNENQPGPVLLGTVSATDNASTVSYALRDDTPTRFSLHTTSGALSYIGSGEDFESIESYTLTVTASDTASPALTAAATIVVAIGDVDDAPNTAPVFIGTPYSFDLDENQPGPVLLGTVSATDNASTVSYALRDDTPTRFSLDTTSGALSYIGSGEDFESIESYTLTVTASDTASPALTAAATIVVAIGDVDDAPNTAPVFIGTPYSFDLDENQPGPVLLGSVSATDNASTVSYALRDDTPTRFSLDTTSGALSYIGSGEDFESIESYTLTVTASDTASPALTAAATIVVAIGDVDDAPNTAPVFIGTPYSFDLDENQAGPVLLGTVSATDNASTVSYALRDDYPTRFSLHTTSGALSYIGSGEDFESIESYTLTVTASDTASPALTAAATIVVAIGDVDDAPNTAPVFIGTPYSFDLDENQPGPVLLGSVSATDNASTVSYALRDDTPTRFSLHTTSGALSYIGSGEDFESIESYTLTVTASDTASPALTAAATIVVAIGDVDDAPNTAPVFVGAPYSFDLDENQPGPVLLGTVSATDNASTVSYALRDDTPTRFSLHTTSGALSYIGSGEDFESIESYTLTVTASDAASPALTAAATIVVAIGDVDDAPNTAPVFVGAPYSFDLDENQAGPVLLGTVSATDNASSVSYALLDDTAARFSLDTTSGALSYIGSGEDFESIESYTLTVTASDAASPALTAAATIVVAIGDVDDAPNTAPVFVGAPYSFVLDENQPGPVLLGSVSATDNASSVSYALRDDTPTRFSLHTTSGALSYIGSGEDFESIESYTLTVTASDAASPALTAAATIVVAIGDVDDAPNTAPVFVGAPYSFVLDENQAGPVLLGSVIATDNASTVSYALLDDTPARFSLAPISGALSYIGSGEDFESIESYTLTVTASDTASPALTAAATIVVAIGDVDDAPNTAPVFIGTPYSFDLNENQPGPVLLGSVSATDNASTVSYALRDDYPTRFSLHTTSGALSYIGSGEDFESIESYTLTVTASDTASPALTAAATIVVAIGDVDDAPNTAPVFIGTPYSFDLNENQPGPVLLGSVSATDNASTVSYALRDDTPTRFSLHTTSGALSYIGSGEDFESIESYTLTVTASDTASPALTAAATIVVAIGDVDDTPNTAPVFVGAPYSFDLDENQTGPVLLGTVSATDNASTVSYALRDDYPTRFSLHTTSGALSYIGSGEDFESIESYTLTVTASDTASPALTAAATIVVAIGDVDDAPNTAPVFIGTPYSFDLDENQPGPVLLGSVSATDNASTVSYALRDDTPTRFSLHTTSGALSYIGSGEDFESIESYTLTVTASDTASPALTAAATIVVAIGDVDDAPNTAPVFIGAPYSFDLDENQPGPVLLGSVSATDNASSVSYALRDDTPTRFSLDTTSGALSYIGSGEDFESIESYTLTVTASDTASPALTAAATIVVAIGDVDDAPNTAPVFVGAPYRFDLDENQPGPVLLGSVSATDNASTVSYALRDDTPTRFSLHTTSGALSYIGSGEDFESIESYTLTVTASDTASPALTAAATIVVAIGDVDDAPNTAPVFIGTPYSFDLDENQPGPVLLGSVSATDNASTVSYALRDDTPTRFSLHTTSGALSYIGSGEDFESIESYTLTVTASDTASPALTAAATIVVAIGDVDDAPNTAPVFIGTPYSFDLDENQPGPVLLGSVSATDNASTVSYALRDDTPTRFSLHTTSGALSYIGSGEDFESIESYTLTVTASDTASPALTAAATIVVAIGDVDDAPNTAPVFIGTPYSFDLDENQPGPVLLGTVSATDNASTVSYALRDDTPTRFSLHTTSGALSYIGSGEDFESIESYTLTVTASDTASPALTAAATIVVAIGDVDDAPNTAPVFIGTPYSFDLNENQPGPVLLGSVSATDNASTVSYALRDDYPTRFSLHTTSGALSYIGSGEDFESIESYTLTVTASDTASPALTAAATIVVAIGDVDDTPNTAPVFVGAPYTFGLDENQPGPVLLGSVSATDNASTVSYALRDDTPTRFSLDTTSGALSYIGSGEDFESIESYTLTVTASDTASPALTAAATIVVAIGDVDDAPNTAPVFVGAPYRFDLDENQPGPVLLGSVSATDNASTVSYALRDDTPTRFSLHTISGALSYIGSGEDFESIESYTLTVTASDTASPALTAAATIVVAIGDVDDTPNTAPVFVGAPYSFDLDENQTGPVLLGSVSATDNASTVSYALRDDTPTRFSLDTISGALSYIGSGEDFESIESYTLTVTASDTASPALTAAATIVVAIGDVDDAPNTAPVFVGAPYRFDLDENQPGPVLLGTVSATDNASTVSYALRDDTPTRFSLDTTSGALSYIGSGEDFESIESYTLTVTASDTASPALTAAATIVVAIGDVDDTPNTAPVFVGAPYSFDLDENQPGPVLLGSVSATDNASTVSYALRDDTPTRFSLHTISGALSYIGSGEDFESIESYTLTVTASDTASPALTAAATIVVAIGDVDDAPNTAPVFVGAPYSFDLDENQSGPVLLGTVSATDNASTVSYALRDDTPTRFSLHTISGALSYIGSGEDFESIESYTLTVTASDTASPALTAAATIVVAIGDVDDTPNTAPVFVGAPYSFDLDENQPGPVLLGTVSATDNASSVSYALRDDTPTRFSLHTISGALSYIGSGEDFESIESYTLTVTASDTASPALTAAATIVVAIGDVDDTPNTAPVFVGAPYSFDLDENQPGPVLLGSVSATDNASTVSYALRDDTPTRFSLHTISGALSYIGSGEDFESIESYTLTVTASDTASPALTAAATIVVAIGDVDDTPNTAPVFVGAPYTFDLNENQPGPVLLGTVSATDNASTVSYALRDDTPTRFSLHTTSGALSYIGSGEDFESIESYTLTVTASDTASPALTAAATIVVAIGDVDDAPNTAPVFVGAPYRFDLDENQPGPVLLGTVSATDNASTVSYALRDDTPTRFSLHTTSGALSYIGSGEDFESIESYTLTVTASDTASPALTAAATIVVAIGDVDDAPNTAPVFVGAPYSFDLNENQPGPVLLGTVSATDNASTVSYALRDDTPTRFSLHTISGALSYIGSGEDFESIESYTLTVTASDTASPALTAAATIVVAIGDVDDAPNTAPVFVGAPYRFDLDENQPGPVLLGTVSATDNASTVSYALRDDTPTRFSLHTTSGALSYIGSGEDFESIESYTLTVTASDTASPALTAAATIVVAIGDVDDAPNTAPVFVGAPYSFDLNENQPGPVLLGTVSATDNASTVSYALRDDTPTRFSLHTISGALSYIGSGEDFESIESYTLTVTASDTASPALTAAATIVVAIGDVDDTPNTAPVFVGAPYTFDLDENQPGPVLLGSVSATDNASTVSYALRDDTPTRFSLDTTSGALSYIGSGEDFESIESYTLTVTASDTASPALTAAATIVVAIGDVDDAPNTAPVFVGAPYSFDLDENQPGPVLLGSVSATDNASTVSYALRDDTPTRFSLHTTSGALSYIGSGEDFESIESYTLTVTASDTASPALTAAATIVVAIGDVDDTPNTAPVFIGTPYSFDLDENQPGPVLLGSVSATDNASTVSYALRDDTPTRFSLHTISGALSYIGSGEDFESIESYTLTVTASDTASPALTAAATIVVAIGDVDDTPNTAPVFIGTPYSFDLDENQPGPVLLGSVSATDNASTVSYALRDDTPTRFSLHTTSGALSYIGSGEDFESIESYTLTVTASDTASPALTAAATIVVAIGDVDDAPNTAPVFVGAPYRFDLDENQPGPVLLGSVSATDNASTVSYALRDDTPTRFSLHTISGALSYIGSGEDFESIESYTLTVTASDTASPALTAAATIVVAIGDVDDTPNTAPVFVGAPYTFGLDENQPGPVLLGSVSATDNASTVSYALRDDTPTRFSLDTTSGALSYIGSGEDFESIESYTLTVTASDTASPALTAAATIVVAIGDVDDTPNTAPVFIGTPYSFDLDENQPGPVLLGSVSATDNASTVSYALRDDTPTRFSLHTISGALSYIGSGEDFESIESYTLTVTASDTASPALTAAATIVVAIGDVDDTPNTAPVFIGTPYSFDLDENQPGPVLLGSVSATDNASTVSYALRDDTPTRFSLHTISGALSYIGSGEDFESIESYTLTVTASDTASPALTAAATIVVAIGDVDDTPNTAPVFVGAPYRFDLDENQPGPVLLGTVSATDNASTVSYALRDDTPTRFSLHTTSGALSYIGSGEDFESIESYTLTVTASDTASPALTAAATIVVAIGDVDDTPNTAPVFIGTPYSFDLDENQPGPVLLGSVSATDNASTVSYALRDDTPTRFSLHTISGALSYIGSGEDFESIESYTLTVTASDTASPALTAAATIVVAIGDVDDTPNTAPVFVGAPYTFDLDENQPGPVLLGSVSATDNASTVSYALRDDTPTRFSLDTTSGALSYIGSGEDFESIESYTLTVTASDTASPALSATAAIVIAIGDVVDNTAPVFVHTEMTKMVLAQVGRNIAIDTVDVLGGRFGAAPHVTVSGNALNAKQWSRLSHWMQLDNWQSEGAWNGVEREVELDLLEQWGQRWDLFRDQLLSGSSFLIPLGAAGDDDGNSGGRLEDWSIWGQGRISGYQHTDAGLKVSGQSLSGYLGVDYRASERLLIGVAVSRSDSDGYSEMAGDGSNHTDIDTELTSVFPYVHWNPIAGLELWGAVGHGQGEVEVKPQEQATIVADIEIAAAAFGVKQALVSLGDMDIAVKADGFVVKIESDGVVGLNATEAESHRLRVALSGNRDWLLSGNARTFSGMELGLRSDGGDTLQGRGLDIGANLGYINPDIGLELSSQLRLLLAYSQNYNEWGLDLTMRLRPGQLGRGLSLALSPGWGQAKAEIDTLWEDGGSVLKPRLSHGSGVIPDRTKLSLSYGLQYKSVLLEPFAQMGVSRDQLSNLKLGVRGSLPWLRVEVSGNNAHQIGVTGVLGF